MFVVLLKFSDNKNKAGEFMYGHNQWIKSGFDDGVFILVGSLQPNLGGSVENVVSTEILEIDPEKADDRLNFLMG